MTNDGLDVRALVRPFGGVDAHLDLALDATAAGGVDDEVGHGGPLRQESRIGRHRHQRERVDFSWCSCEGRRRTGRQIELLRLIRGEAHAVFFSPFSLGAKLALRAGSDYEADVEQVEPLPSRVEYLRVEWIVERRRLKGKATVEDLAITPRRQRLVPGGVVKSMPRRQVVWLALA